MVIHLGVWGLVWVGYWLYYQLFPLPTLFLNFSSFYFCIYFIQLYLYYFTFGTTLIFGKRFYRVSRNLSDCTYQVSDLDDQIILIFLCNTPSI